MLKSVLFAGAAALALSTPALAEIMVKDAYARASTGMSQSGAAFMEIHNTGPADRLIGAASDAADKVELHTHKENDQGVMRMVHVEEGFDIPAGGVHMLARGGDHVMFLGLKEPFEQGRIVTVTLTFEQAGDVTVEIPVDLERKPSHGAMGHGAMGHGAGHGMTAGN